jgi:ATP-dependent RNA helicase RhlE
LIFTRTKHGANKVAKILVQAGIGAEAIHGNKSQTARQNALKNFKDGKIRALVATDIAARGIDIDGLTHVINFDIPNIPRPTYTASDAPAAPVPTAAPSPSATMKRRSSCATSERGGQERRRDERPQHPAGQRERGQGQQRSRDERRPQRTERNEQPSRGGQAHREQAQQQGRPQPHPQEQRSAGKPDYAKLTKELFDEENLKPAPKKPVEPKRSGISRWFKRG